MSTMRTTRLPWTLLVLAVVVVGAIGLAACGEDDESGDDGGGSGGGTEQVTFALGFSPNYVQAYFFNALDQGFYEDAGLDVEFVVPESTQTAAKLVGVGRADFGEYIGTDPVAAVGEGIPIKGVLTFSWGENGLMADPNGPVQSLADLVGGEVGTFDLVYDDVCRPRLLEENGVDPESVETVDVGFTSVPPLLNGRVDASEGGKPFETVSYEIETGEEPRYFSFSEVCPPLFQGVIVNSEWAEENPDTARAFVEATIEGVKSYAEDPKGTRTRFQDRFSDLEDPLINFDEVAGSLCGPDAAENGLGYNEAGEWERLIDITVEGGEIDEAPEVDEVITDEYLPEDPITSTACE